MASENINQIFTANPITTNVGTDLMYFGRSPYGLTNDAAMTYANFSAQFGAPFTPAALTEVNDTNVTLTLGGTPSTALLQAVSMTLGWSGLLSVARGGTGVGTFTPYSIITAGTTATGAFQNVVGVGTTGNVLTSQGAGALPIWAAPATSGTVTSIATNNGITGGTITATGTIGLASVANLSILANVSGGSTFPTPNTISAILDATIGATQGDVIYRNAATWVALAPGSSGQFLTSGGAAANISWSSGNVGTVTSVATNNGLTGGTITSSGTLGLASIPTLNILSNITAGSTFPSGNTLTATIDAAIGNVQGDILYRNAAAWVVLPPGTAGQVLSTGGTAANPSWVAAGGVGTVTSITVGTGLTGSTSPITSSGTISLTSPVAVTLGGTGLNATTINQILYSSGTNTIAGLATANNGVLVTSAAGVPSISTTLPSGLTIPGFSSSAWVDQTSASVTMATNTGYTSDDGATLVTFTLPTTSAIGDFVEINGKGSGLWKIAQAAGQQIHVGSSTTTSGTGGSLASTLQYDNVRLRCLTANTIWTTTEIIGNLTVV
jgi:hypothetical protein